jgi:hypothetical protein
MSDSDRVNVSKVGLIIGLLLALGICVSWIGYGLSKSAEYERQADNKRSEYSEYTRQKIADTCVGIPDLEAVKCRYEALDAQREHDSNQSDLIAQRQSALWAYIMGAAAVIGMALSAVGVWLVKATFDATREANIIQKTAMKNAEIDAKEARDALVESDRAVVIVPGSMRGTQEPGGTVSLQFIVENNGRTAAKGFEIAFSLSNEPFYKSRRTYVRRFNEMCLSEQTLRFSKVEIKRNSIAQKYVIGYVSYRAIHGVQFKTYFCYLAIVASNIRNRHGTDTYDLVKRSCKGLPANT